MRQIFWALAVVAHAVSGYPGPLNIRQQAINSSGVLINSFANGSFPTSTRATSSYASGVSLSNSSTDLPPTATTTSISSSNSPSSAVSSTDLSSDIAINTGSAALNSTGALFTTSASSTNNHVTTGASVTGLPGTGSSVTSHIVSSSSMNGTVIIESSLTSASTNPPGTTIGISSTNNPTATIASGSFSITSTPATGTITSSASLSTISIVSLSTQSTSITGILSNTEVTTTNDKGHHTVVPFLWGCWFCGGGGLLLWGVGPLPGIYPPPVPPPFPSWPVITIGNDNVPTPEPSQDSVTNTSPTETPTTASLSSTAPRSSCAASTITDYWVSCAPGSSGTTSSCSTYSSSIASGCSLTPVTTTTASLCTAPASVDSDSLLPGETAGPEYDFVDPLFSDATPLWSYTVAVVESKGIIGAIPTSSNSAGPTTGANDASVLSTTMKPTTSPSVTISLSPPLCTPFQDPDNGITGYCQCSSGSFITTTPFRTSSSDPCGYTALTIPPPVTTTPPTTIDNNPFPFTTTDTAGDIVACASSSLSYLAVAGGLTFTYCDGSSTTVSTASSTAPPPPPTSAPPSADCALWDEGWGWEFEVYNIQGWSTDGGKGLHHNENGCGALTGWSWTNTPSGGQAYFNLPFFIKSGCVERAIVSAGGPKISCQKNGLGKREVSIKTLVPRADATHTVNPPNFNNATIANAYNPPNIDINTIEHVYLPATWTNSRRSPLDISEIYQRSLLHKRGCIPSKQVAPAPNPPPAPAPAPAPLLICNPIIPGVDECNTQVIDYGNVGRKTSIFYTGWGTRPGGIMARKYASKNMCGIVTVSWTGLCDPQWRDSVQKAIMEPFKRPGITNAELSALVDKADPFLKNLSQAFAETSKGDVYVFIPQGQLPGNQWDLSSAWGGWEYPALTANADVERILRVDLDVSDYDNPTGTPVVIWDRAKGDGKANYEPKGIRGPSLPDGLPADQIPSGWNQAGSL